LNKYRFSKTIEDWRKFKKAIKKTKHIFFNDKIEEIVLKNKRPRNLINWVKKQKVPVIEALQYNRHLFIELKDL